MVVHDNTLWVFGGHTAWTEPDGTEGEKVHDDVWRLDLTSLQVLAPCKHVNGQRGLAPRACTETFACCPLVPCSFSPSPVAQHLPFRCLLGWLAQAHVLIRSGSLA